MRENNFSQLKNVLLEDLTKLDPQQQLPIDFQQKFMKLVELVTFSLLHAQENFFGHCTVQMKREIRTDMATATGVTADLTHFNLYFNPFIFLKYSLAEMKAVIKHQLYHVIMQHMKRAAKLEGKYNLELINTAMDISINQFIRDLPEDELTIEKVEKENNTLLPRDQPFEIYCELLKKAQEDDDNEESDDKDEEEQDKEEKSEEEESEAEQEENNAQNTRESSSAIEKEHDQGRCHDIWNESSGKLEMDDLEDLTKKLVGSASRGHIPVELLETLELLKKRASVNWQRVVRKMIGTLPVPYRKTITRKNRRQPDRLDLKGVLPRQVVRIIVAIDTSASMGKEELEKSFAELFSIVKLYRHDITIIECDAKVNRVYKATTPRDIKLDISGRGGTAYSPVFEYIADNKLNKNLLIYFTDGCGEEELTTKPRNNRTIWVLTGDSQEISLKEPYGIVLQANSATPKHECGCESSCGCSN